MGRTLADGSGCGSAVFDKVGYPSVDVAALKKIHPGLSSFTDYAAGSK